MENRDVSEVEGRAGVGPSRTLRAVAILGFGIPLVVHLLRGRWVTATFFAASIALFLRGREIDGWPKPRRYAAIAVYVALAAGMLAEVFWQVWPLLRGQGQP